MNSPSMDCRP